MFILPCFQPHITAFALPRLAENIGYHGHSRDANVMQVHGRQPAPNSALANVTKLQMLADRKRRQQQYQQIQDQMEATENANKKRKTRDGSH